TAHANSAKDALLRLESMILMAVDLPIKAIRRQIASGVDIIIQLGRVRDKSRKVLEIVEVIGMEDDEIVLNPLYEFIEKECNTKKVEGCLVKINDLKEDKKLKMAGIQNE
ncbi:MAG: CpaF family protein, partial [Lachnospiraceae bacterium]